MKKTQILIGLCYLAVGVMLIWDNKSIGYGQFALMNMTGIFCGIALGWLGVKLIKEA